MKPRTKLTSLVIAGVLSAVIAGPTLGAPPTFDGLIYCVSKVDGTTLVELDTVDGWTKKHINERVRFWEKSDTYVAHSCYADVVKL